MENDNTKKIRFGFLVWKSMPEIMIYQIFASLILMIASTVISRLIALVADSTGHALTTGNMKEMLMTWRTPVILLLGLLLVFCFVMFEIMVQIYLCDDILNGRKGLLWTNIKKAFGSLKRFLNPSGIGLMLFVLFAVPLCGIGFSVSLTKSFTIPNFIFDVIRKNPVFLTGYYVLIVFFIITAYFWAFSFHGILLDGLSPKAARKRSKELLQGNHVKFIITMILIFLIFFLIRYALSYIATTGIENSIENAYSDVSYGYPLDILNTGISSLDAVEKRVVEYRILSCVYIFLFTFIISMISFLSNTYLMMRLTRFYHEFKEGTVVKRWPARPANIKKWWRILIIVLTFAFFVVAAVPAGLFFDEVFVRDNKVNIIAHRCGGAMASENSLEGIEAAIENECFGSETDIQRTKDGYYIINHDNTFRRMAGVDKASDEMTLAEIKELRVRDTTGNGRTVSIPTLEEVLDATKDREVLYIELKGKTADRQMVDDVVQIVRDRDMVYQVALISLKGELIDYAETTYPEFETGVLIFGALGNVALMNCDDVIMEEQMATDDVIERLHGEGKQALVWTVNEVSYLQRFLASEADAVITDEVYRAQEVQADLDTRTDLQVALEKIERITEE